MRFSELLKIERMKYRRSKIIPLIFIAPILVVSSGIANLSAYFTPEYTNAWPTMFIQSALLYAYYLLPFSMIVVCVMIASQETNHNGLFKMMSLPISRQTLSLAKFCILIFYLFMEIFVFLAVFVIAGYIAVSTFDITEALPISYLLKWCVGLFLTMLPSLAVMWMLTVLFEKTLFSVGLNLLLVIPGLLAGASPVWFLYPYCYSGYLVSLSLHAFTTEGTADTALQLFPFIPCALLIFLSALFISASRFGKQTDLLK